MAYRMFAVDLDGTLLTGDKRISEANKKALKQATESGIHVVLSTGRAWPGARAFAEELGIRVPVITSNGAMIIDGATGEIMYKKDMEPEAAREIIEDGVRIGTSQIIWAENQLYGLPIDERLIDYGQRFGKMDPLPLPPVESLFEVGISKVLWYDTVERSEQLWGELKQYRDTVVVRSDPHFLEFFNIGVSKAKAIVAVADILGVKREEIAAIGDADNDLPMLETAGLGIAMGNANERVKAAADRITTDNEHDGVAYAVHHFLMN